MGGEGGYLLESMVLALLKLTLGVHAAFSFKLSAEGSYEYRNVCSFVTGNFERTSEDPFGVFHNRTCYAFAYHQLLDHLWGVYDPNKAGLCWVEVGW